MPSPKPPGVERKSERCDTESMKMLKMELSLWELKAYLCENVVGSIEVRVQEAVTLQDLV